jgi:hypothetical protein
MNLSLPYNLLWATIFDEKDGIQVPSLGSGGFILPVLSLELPLCNENNTV